MTDPDANPDVFYPHSFFSFTESDYVCQNPGTDFCAAAITEAEEVQ